MGRIGKSYPRFEDTAKSPALRGKDDGNFYQVAGAVVGVLCALGLIGWLLLR